MDFIKLVLNDPTNVPSFNLILAIIWKQGNVLRNLTELPTFWKICINLGR